MRFTKKLKVRKAVALRKNPGRFITRLDRSPDLWRGRCLFMQPDLHRTLHSEYPSEQTMPEKAQIGEELCDHPGWDTYN